jgi:hypothetical protein
MESNPHLQQATLEVVQNQLDANDPPETNQTYKRLLEEGYTEKDAKRLIGCVVSAEIFDILKKQQEFDHKRFVEALNKLPKMPGESLLTV